MYYVLGILDETRDNNYNYNQSTSNQNRRDSEYDNDNDNDNDYKKFLIKWIQYQMHYILQAFFARNTT